MSRISLVLCVALALPPMARAHAPASPDASAREQPATAEPAAAPEPARSDPAEPTADPAAAEPAAAEPAAAEPAAAEPATAPAKTAAPTATKASASPARETTPARKVAAGTDEGGAPRLSKVEQAGWWTLFGAFVLATTAGVLGGLAEREEDRATRLAVRIDQTGADVRYADVQQEYEQALDRGEAYAKSGIVLAAMAGATAVAGVLVFAIDAAKRKRKGARERGARGRAALSGAGIEVRF